jgi:hypothetical protein
MEKFALAILLFVSSTAWADINGGDLSAACFSEDGTLGDKICNAYVNGFVNGILNDQVAREQGKPICIDDTSTSQVREG